MKKIIFFIIICLATLSVFLFLYFKITKKEAIISVTASLPTASQPFTILLVPGHDTDTDCNNGMKCNSGASYKSIYERDLVVDLANNISTLLSQDSKYKVVIARDKKAWNPTFASYFTDKKQATLDFKNQHQVAYKLLIASGQQKVIPNTGKHTTADQKTAIELYGINKWADENKVDLIIHLHFNNATRRHVNLPGPNKGFDIFIPDKQRVNAMVSRIIAENIYKELQKKFTPETAGNNYNSLYEDQDLIALGASDTLIKPAILIEYAYIYEKDLQTSKSRKNTLEQMAEQTVAGIQDYFNRK